MTVGALCFVGHSENAYSRSVYEISASMMRRARCDEALRYQWMRKALMRNPF